MRTFIVKYVPDESDDLVIHKIQIPDYYDKGFYRTIGSWNSFCSGKIKGSLRDHTRRTPCWSPTGLYYVGDHIESQWLDNVKRRVSSYGDTFDETKLPTVEHKSLYDFYDYIGFDRKTRRYREG